MGLLSGKVDGRRFSMLLERQTKCLTCCEKAIFQRAGDDAVSMGKAPCFGRPLDLRSIIVNLI